MLRQKLADPPVKSTIGLSQSDSPIDYFEGYTCSLEQVPECFDVKIATDENDLVI